METESKKVSANKIKITKSFNNYFFRNLHLCLLQPNIHIKLLHRIDVHLSDKSSQKKNQAYIVNSTCYIDVSIYIQLHLCLLWRDRQTDGQIIHRVDAH